MSRKFALGSVLAAGLGLALATSAQAGVMDGAVGALLQSTQIAPVEDAQFFFGGQNYCWYDSGWQGPGWYWCGYAWRRGFGWGGGAGFHGWARGGRGGHIGGGRPGGHGPVGRPGGHPGGGRPGGHPGGHGGGAPKKH